MEKFIKQLTGEESANTQEVLRLLKTEQKIKPTIALVGESGSGKSTTAMELVGRDIQWFLSQNRGVSKTSKVATQVSFLNSNVDNELLEIEFVKSFDFSLINTALMSSLIEKLTNARGKDISNENKKMILEEVIVPKSEAYTLKRYYDECTEDTKLKMSEYIDRIIDKIYSDTEIFKQIKREQQQNKNELASKIYKKVFSDKVSEVIERECREDSIMWQQALEEIIESIRIDIYGLISSDEKFSESNVFFDEVKKIRYIIINTETRGSLKKLLAKLYTDEGRDLVISRITFYANKVEQNESEDNNGFIKYSISDLKGLEEGETNINECIQTLKRINTNAVCVYSNIVKTENKVLNEFISELRNVDKMISINMIYTHLDEFIKKYQRNKYDEAYYSGEIETLERNEKPKRSDDKDKNDLYISTLENALLEIETKMTKMNDQAKADNFIGATLLSDESDDVETKEIGSINEVKTYIDNIYLKHKFSKESILISCSVADYNKITCKLDEKLVCDLATSFVDDKDIEYRNAFYKYRNLNLHWNTKYTWISKHRNGYGWSSAAKVYDNISIYIFNTIRSNFQREIDKNGLQNNGLSKLFKDVKGVDNIENIDSNEAIKLIRDAFDQNTFNQKLYYYMGYEKICDTFNRGMYTLCLDELNEKLQDEEYVKESIKEFALSTFEGLKIQVLKRGNECI